jgi:hypothetical protein
VLQLRTYRCGATSHRGGSEGYSSKNARPLLSCNKCAMCCHEIESLLTLRVTFEKEIFPK